MRAVIYARFSPRSKAKDCDSCERQIADLRNEAIRNCWTVAEPPCHDDALSGADHERPELQRAIGQLKRGTVLMVRNLDRLGRDTGYLVYVEGLIRKSGARLFSMEDGGLLDLNDIDQMIIRLIKYWVAEKYRITSAKRTKRRMLELQAGGRRMSAIIPFGWTEGPDETVIVNGEEKIQRRIIEDEDEQAAIRRVVELHKLGETLRGICGVLTAEGLDCRGGTWHHTTVRAILKRANGAPTNNLRLSHE